ncbi:MAG: hypothetical protein ACON4F_08780 [Candidatus Puniceispirillaceae bacterium]
MTYTTVSFFKDMSLSNLQRRQGFATRTEDILMDVIRTNMRQNEDIACFLTQDGEVVALHRNGLFVRV